MRLNEFLVRQGIAPVQRDDVTLLSQDAMTQQYLMKLLAAETKARNAKLGLWKDLEEEEEEEPKGVQGVIRRSWAWLVGKVKGRLRSRKEVTEGEER